MNDDNDPTTYNQVAFTPPPAKRSRTGLKIALVSAGIAAGAIGATALGASATTAGSGTTAGTAATSSTSTAAPTAPSGAPSGAPKGAPGGRPANAHGAASVRSDEKVVTGSTAATLKAAALKAVPGGTVYRVETDSGDAKYEVHMTKADGTEVTVKFDANLEQTAVETGMGK